MSVFVVLVDVVGGGAAVCFVLFVCFVGLVGWVVCGLFAVCLLFVHSFVSFFVGRCCCYVCSCWCWCGGVGDVAAAVVVAAVLVCCC